MYIKMKKKYFLNETALRNLIKRVIRESLASDDDDDVEVQGTDTGEQDFNDEMNIMDTDGPSAKEIKDVNIADLEGDDEPEDIKPVTKGTDGVDLQRAMNDEEYRHSLPKDIQRMVLQARGLNNARNIRTFDDLQRALGKPFNNFKQEQDDICANHGGNTDWASNDMEDRDFLRRYMNESKLNSAINKAIRKVLY